MKQLLTTLLILICFSCGDEHDKNYPRNDTTQKEREHDETLDVVSDWAYDKCTEYFDKSIFLSNASGNRDSINKYNYLGEAMREVHTKVLSLKYRNKKHESLPKPSPLPDTVKPIKDKIKMQPRWRDSLISEERVQPILVEPSPYDNPFYITPAYPSKKDTTKVIMLVSDTSSQNGFRSSRCFWMYGYQVSKMSYGELTSMYCTDKEGNVIKCPDSAFYEYLNENKRSLPKNIVVWMSKEIK